MAVAEEHSFSRAAKRLGVTQPVLSRSIKELEEEIGTTLFNRTSSGVTLTDAGQKLLPRADEALLILDETVEELRQMGRDKDEHLEVGYLTTALNAFLGSALQTFCQTMPSISIHPYEMSPKEQIDGLDEGNLDIAFIGIAPEYLATTYDFFKIYDLEMSLVVSAENPIASQSMVSTDAVTGMQLISLSPIDFVDCERAIRLACEDAGWDYAPLIKANSIQSAMAAVASIDGFTLIPSIAESMAPEQVKFVSLDRRIGDPSFSAIVQRNEKRKSVLAFLQECRRVAQRTVTAQQAIT